MEAFTRNIDHFYEKYDTLDICMRKFDETLSYKASKSQFAIFKESLNHEFIHVNKINDIYNKLKENENQMDAKGLNQ